MKSHLLCIDGEQIYNLIIREGVFPECWKIAKAVSVFKKGDCSSTENYKPIAFILNFTKVFEAVLASICRVMFLV